MAKCGYCRGEVLSPCRCNDVEVSQEKKAAAELLAAEVNYLSAFKWIPCYGPRDRGISEIKWLRAGTPGQEYTQAQALQLQKYLDPTFKEA